MVLPVQDFKTLFKIKDFYIFIPLFCIKIAVTSHCMARCLNFSILGQKLPKFVMIVLLMVGTGKNIAYTNRKTGTIVFINLWLSFLPKIWSILVKLYLNKLPEN